MSTKLKGVRNLKAIIQQLRPKQWTKNLLVFAAPVFAEKFIDIQAVTVTLLAFICFCFTASTVYILNDIMDVEKDRLHPEKSKRPIASGALSIRTAIFIGVFLLLSSLLIAYLVEPLFAAVLIIYFVVNVFYSISLKHVVIVDVMIIALGFVLRGFSGAIVIEVHMTAWFILCTMLLALFLALSKRRHELELFSGDKLKQRRVLEHYSTGLLDQMISIVTSATIMSYSLYAATTGPNTYMMWTIPFVLYGIFRYLYLVHMKEGGGSPEKVLLDDKHILGTVVLFGLSVMIIKIYFQ
ncbi:decaprenyl-phosphate phosphoribosyltransferase [Ammoniphilus sp. CFH 90114]|uniref:decaprenyl-phosphate phosphoribosyltransferase n=1 Tax=Ammoniphilus sp. CFH 90114 TaxID=2493665 RepID=UPI00100F0A6E|nr:decaprenyl-phosphate phosphoribosyltransferase [Ammoniphilus sp. CFH 90114]RXT04523.1 decaprenyl-phosphate phosphoribosyltransferase [Ammoniphilus sp. CFH 90114]